MRAHRTPVRWRGPVPFCTRWRVCAIRDRRRAPSR